MKVIIDATLLANQGIRYRKIAHAIDATGASTKAMSADLDAFIQAQKLSTGPALRQAVARAISHIDRAGSGLDAISLDLRRRAGLVEVAPGLVGAAGLAHLTPAQRKYLFPTGSAAIALKRKLAELARRMNIRPPKGFNPNSPVTGWPARRLIRMIQAARGKPTVGAFNHAMRQLLRTIQLPTSWPALLKYPGNGAGKQKLACWLAANAAKNGAPPILAVMCSIPESGVTNIGGGDRDSVGFFQIRAGIHPVPPGFGAASGSIRSESWWHAHPEAQMAWWAREMKRVRPSGASASTKDPDQLANWAYGIERCAAEYRHRYRDAYQEAKRLVDRCTTAPSSGVGGGGLTTPRPTRSPYLFPTGAAAVLLKTKLEILAKKLHVPIPRGFDPNSPSTGSTARVLLRRIQEKLGLAVTGTFNRPIRQELHKIQLPGSPFAQQLLAVAAGEVGVRETSYNWSPRIKQYLTAAHVNYPAPWCAGFVTWALAKAGDPTPFRSAAVASWVDAARNHRNGMRIIPPGEVRPGDLVCYDWGGGSDFGGDGHIGIVTSEVKGGRFKTIEGNTSSAAVSRLDRSLGGGPNIIFIRVEK